MAQFSLDCDTASVVSAAHGTDCGVRHQMHLIILREAVKCRRPLRFPIIVREIVRLFDVIVRFAGVEDFGYGRDP